MQNFENRLIGTSKKQQKKYAANQEQPLKGEKLIEYINKNKETFGENGDALCVSAGYGEFSEDGTPLCHFKPFVKELGIAMQENENHEQNQ